MSTESSGAAPTTATQFIGRYQILERIAEGGMGSLYLARDPVIERLLAIKVLRRGYDSEELRERFAREGRAAGRLRHPNIVTIFDVGEHEGNPFIAMEFLAGETVAGLIQQGARLALTRRLKLIEELCDGLAYAHRAGIVHRDIKPANLMVIAEGTLKILDFGIVRIGDAGTTQAGRVVGTVNYMSPEQVTGEGVDHRSDIFAVGLVAYELLSYRQAFPGKLSEAIFHRILNVIVDPLDAVCPVLDPDVVAIVNQALKRDPAARYQAVAQMRNDLSRVRQRLELEEEQRAASAIADAGETIIFSSTSPSPVAPPTPARSSANAAEPPAPVRSSVDVAGATLEDARRALTGGDYKSAMIIAARTAAVNPADVEASAIFDKAHTSLLEHARKSGVDQRPPTSRSGEGTARWRGWVIPAAAVLLAAIVGAIVWQMREPDPGPLPSATETNPSEPPAPGPSTVPVPTPGSQDPSPPTTPGPERRADATPSEPAKPATPPPPAPPRSTQRERERAPEPRTSTPSSPPATTPPADTTTTTPDARRAESGQPRRAGVDVEPPRRITYVDPVYPAAARTSRARGVVQLELTISREGRVADARVVGSAPPFDQAALQAAKQWEYAPTIVNGETVPVIHTVSVPFAPPADAEPAPREPVPVNPAPTPPPPAKPAPQVSAPDVNAEMAAIRGVLRRYEEAWQALDVAALRRVHALSNGEAEAIDRTMRDAQSYDVTVAVEEIAVSGNRAQVVARVSRRFRPRAGRATDVTEIDTIDLEKRGDTWIIVRFARR